MSERSDTDRDEGIIPDDLDISEDAHVSELGDGRFVISPNSSDAPPADEPLPAEQPPDDRRGPESPDPHEDAGHGRLSSGVADADTDATSGAGAGAGTSSSSGPGSSSGSGSEIGSRSRAGSGSGESGPLAGAGGVDRSLADPASLANRESDAVAADRLDAADVGVDLRAVLREHVASSTCRHGFLISAKFDDDVRHFEAFSDDIDEVFGTLLAWYADQVDEETPVEDVLGILLAAAALDVRFPKGTLAQLLREHEVGPEDSVADLLATVSANDGFRLPRFRSGKR